MIFAELEYSDLKVCTMVSKSVSSLLDYQCFDRVLFRRFSPRVNCKRIRPGSVSGSGYHPDDEDVWVKIHPAFSMMSYCCSPDIEDPCFYNNQPVIETSAATEYATMPALQRLKIKIYGYPAIIVKNKAGVTVRKVLKALVKHFGRKIPGVMFPDGSRATYQDVQGDHNGWVGFDYQYIDDDGTLVLVADSFDS